MQSSLNYVIKDKDREVISFNGLLTKIVGLVRMADNQYTSIIWLKQGFYTIVDSADYENLSKLKIYLTYSNYKTQKTATIIFEGKTTGLHRYLLMNALTANQDEYLIDHINGNPLDNRRANLRLATRAQNAANSRLNRNNTSGYKGVHKYKVRPEQTKIFEAVISINSKNCRIGSFYTAREAAIAYDEAVIKLRGEFAKTNKMLGLL